MLTVHRLVTGRWRENCYVVHGAGGEAIVVDPGDDGDAIERYVDENALRVRAILNTHAHYDHVGAVSRLQEKYGAPFHLHSADVRLLSHANLYRHLFDGTAIIRVPRLDVDLASLSRLDWGDLEIEVIATPGHTPGGVCFRLGNDLFTGDTLFRNQIGRADLPGGDAPALQASVERLLSLQPDIIIHPGHGEAATLGEAGAHLARARECS